MINPTKRKPGRPPATDKRKIRTIKMTDAEWQEIQARAMAAGDQRRGVHPAGSIERGGGLTAPAWEKHHYRKFVPLREYSHHSSRMM